MCVVVYIAIYMRTLVHVCMHAYILIIITYVVVMNVNINTYVHACMQLRTPHSYILWLESSSMYVAMA